MKDAKDGSSYAQVACGRVKAEDEDARRNSYRFRVFLVNPLARGACTLIIVSQIHWTMYN